MDFAPPVAVRPLLARIERFIADVVIPAEAEVFERGFNASAARLADLRAQCKAAGLWGPQLPVDHGGLGLDLVSHGLVSAWALRLQLPGA
jgi:acyl-CoA dehydrogenase